MPFQPEILDWSKCEWTVSRDKMRFLTYQGAESMTTTLTEATPGHEPGPHSHIYEQLVIILQGECDFYVDGKCYHLTAGCLMAVPPNIEHNIVATGNVPVLNLDVFTPHRAERIESKIAENEEDSARKQLGLFFTDKR